MPGAQNIIMHSAGINHQIDMVIVPRYQIDARLGVIGHRLIDIGEPVAVPVELFFNRAINGIIVELIGHVVRQNWDVEQFLVSSFIHHEIRKVRRMDDRIRIGALVGGIPVDYAAFAEGLTAYSVNASIEFISREFVKDAHSRGLRIFIYTVNHPDDVKRMMSLKVDGVFSDYPERVLSILERSEEGY